jgi:uncharacterized protein YkwD
MRRLLGAVVLGACLLLPATGPASAGAGAAATTQRAQSPAVAYARTALRATNKVRLSHSRATFSRSTCLARKAWWQARRMADQRRIFHQDLGPLLRACGLDMAGENVADGYANGNAVVYQGWMKSPPHRANILERRFRLIAVGAVRGSDGRWYVSQVFGRHA